MIDPLTSGKTNKDIVCVNDRTRIKIFIQLSNSGIGHREKDDEMIIYFLHIDFSHLGRKLLFETVCMKKNAFPSNQTRNF